MPETSGRNSTPPGTSGVPPLAPDLPHPPDAGGFSGGVPWKVLLLSAAYFFFILTSYYMLRPIRETMAIERGADKLPWLMTATLVVMLLVNPVYAFLVSRFPRRKFVPFVHYFFALNIVGFFAATKLLSKETLHTLGYAFYIWLSVFNLFVVSIFWSIMADVFGRDRAKKVFGVIAVGGTLGAICGPLLVNALLGGKLALEWPFGKDPAAWTLMEFPKLAREWVFLAALVPLQAAILCAAAIIKRGEAWNSQPAAPSASREPTADALAGFRLIKNSRYLQTLSLYMLLFTITSTFIYVEQANMIAAKFPDADARTKAFANLDLYTNLLTLVTQLFLTRQIIRFIGVGGTLAVLPAITFAGFGALAATGSVPVLYAYQVIRRGMHYAVDRPAREVLYTPLSPDEKYKSKAFIDTFVYRAGDMLGGWAPTWLAAAATWFGLKSPIPAAVLWLPLSLLWIATAIVLGIMQRSAAQQPRQ
ncbi:MAG: MFS transporter [Phycisphaerae bacterium]|nr:MFS transporter [Phycisphaerae bacterium]